MINKYGVVTTSQLSEIFVNEYDLTNYVEPDGSTWIRIFHHNNPSGGLFSSANDFSKPVYIDSNRWFNCQLLNQVNNNRWELMIKQKLTSSTTEEKYRWIQTVNPYTATFNDTVYSNVTKITGDGYSTFENGGGMYLFSFQTCFVINNYADGNWFGAIGSWTAYQDGIPAYPNTIVTTGYMDLYLRLDNSNNTNDILIGKNYIRPREIIEV